MQINADTPILDLDDKPLTEGEHEMTVGRVCVAALAQFLPGDENMDGIAKVTNLTLALTLHKGGTIDLTAEQIALLKTRVGKLPHMIAVGRTLLLLDPPPPKLVASVKKRGEV